MTQKPQRKHNRLIVTLNESLRAKIIQGSKESFRVNTIDRAKEITKRYANGVVKSSVFTDSYGKHHTIA